MSIFEIALLSLIAMIGASIVWYSVMVGISPMPSSNAARRAIIQLSGDTGTGPIYELGSGWGNLMIPLAKKYPQRTIIGYELSIVPWLATTLLIQVLGLKNITLYRQDFLHADLSEASLITCYLFSEGMQTLERKLEMENGKLEYLISHNFSLPSHTATQTIQLNDLYKSPVYLYSFANSDDKV